MDVAAHYELPYRVRFDECSPTGTLRSSGFLRYAQDVAWRHSETAGFGRDWYRGRGLTWLIRALELDILDEIAYGQTIDVSTEVLGFRRAWARRRTEFTGRDSERALASATIDWILLDGKGRAVRVPPELLDVFRGDDRAAFTPLRISLRATPDAATTTEFAVRATELDPMGHVNNAAYIDYVEAHLLKIGREADVRSVPRRFRVEYVGAATADDCLVGRGWPEDLAWCYRLEDGDGRELVRARFETDPATWVGG